MDKLFIPKGLYFVGSLTDILVNSEYNNAIDNIHYLDNLNPSFNEGKLHALKLDTYINNYKSFYSYRSNFIDLDFWKTLLFIDFIPFLNSVSYKPNRDYNIINLNQDSIFEVDTAPGPTGIEVVVQSSELILNINLDFT